MNLRTPLAALCLGLLVTAPSVGGPPSWDHHGGGGRSAQLTEVRAEIEAIQTLALEVHDPALRRDLYTRARHASDALDDAERQLRMDWEPAPRGLSYDDALTIVRRESFESDRLEAIRRLASMGGRFTTEEVRGIVAECTFESTRRDALVALYPTVRDPQRFELALDVLTWSSSRADVLRRLGY